MEQCNTSTERILNPNCTQSVTEQSLGIVYKVSELSDDSVLCSAHEKSKKYSLGNLHVSLQTIE